MDDLYKMGGYMVLAPTGRMRVVDERQSQALGREVRVRVHIYRPVKYGVGLERRLWFDVHYNSLLARGQVPFPTPSGLQRPGRHVRPGGFRRRGVGACRRDRCHVWQVTQRGGCGSLGNSRGLPDKNFVATLGSLGLPLTSSVHDCSLFLDKT